jgi:LuxR family maltose regulon positive regulatory protein
MAGSKVMPGMVGAAAPLKQIAEAQRHVEQGSQRGNAVITAAHHDKTGPGPVVDGKYSERLGLAGIPQGGAIERYVFYNSPMPAPIIATKLYIPLPRPKAVLRPRLIERLNEGSSLRVTLISAPAGFGKTTLVSEWLAGCGRPAAWLSLDEGDNDPTRFLSYLVAALQTLALSGVEGVAADFGAGVSAALQSPQPPSTESILTTLLNEVTAIPKNFVLVLDDYHVIDAEPVDHALAFLVEHLPPRMHLVIATREDPHLPLARLRARGQLTELRAATWPWGTPPRRRRLRQAANKNIKVEIKNPVFWRIA